MVELEKKKVFVNVTLTADAIKSLVVYLYVKR